MIKVHVLRCGNTTVDGALPFPEKSKNPLSFRYHAAELYDRWPCNSGGTARKVVDVQNREPDDVCGYDEREKVLRIGQVYRMREVRKKLPARKYSSGGRKTGLGK
ncbi:MAG: hypothetical protein PUC44_02470 [Eubacteriales bacterium]|nr:hypothetical protein [Eubacteriales bacterium]